MRNRRCGEMNERTEVKTTLVRGNQATSKRTTKGFVIIRHLRCIRKPPNTVK